MLRICTLWYFFSLEYTIVKLLSTRIAWFAHSQVRLSPCIDTHYQLVLRFKLDGVRQTQINSCQIHVSYSSAFIGKAYALVASVDVTVLSTLWCQ